MLSVAVSPHLNIFAQAQNNGTSLNQLSTRFSCCIHFSQKSNSYSSLIINIAVETDFCMSVVCCYHHGQSFLHLVYHPLIGSWLTWPSCLSERASDYQCLRLFDHTNFVSKFHTLRRQLNWGLDYRWQVFFRFWYVGAQLSYKILYIKRISIGHFCYTYFTLLETLIYERNTT